MLTPPASPLVAPLVGRAAELARFADALDRTAAGAGETVFLAGEAGVGKTRLAGAVKAEAARRGWGVAEGRAFAVETGVPYAVFADALVPLLRGLDPASLAVATRGATSELARVFPTLFPDARGAAPRAEHHGDAKARLYWSVAQLVGRLAVRRPLLLVLDNLQWADAASLELLHFVARQSHARAPGVGRLLLIGVYNDAERELNALLCSTERSLASLDAARVERIAPLSAEDTAELVRRTFDAVGAPPGFVAHLHGWTRGNPFFVEETLKSLVESGRLRQRDGGWTGWDEGALALPPSVRDAVLERVGRLAVPARRVLDLAAVIGGRVRFAALEATCDLGREDLLAALDELRRARILVDAGGARADTLDFVHPIVRDTVYAELGGPRVRLLHGRIAAALETLYAGEVMAHADELAYHLTRSEEGPRPRAYVYLAEAGRQALSRSADRSAAQYLQTALDLLDASAGAGPDATPASAGAAGEAPVVEALARARTRLGERDAAVRLWRRLEAGAAARGDARTAARARRRLGLIAFSAGQHGDALEHYAAARALAEGAGAHDVVATLRLDAANSLQALGRHGDARAEVGAALDVATPLGDDVLLARVERALLLLHAWTGPASEARAHGERAIALACGAGERNVEWSAHWAMAILGGLTGDAAATARHLAASERIAEELGSPTLRLWTADVAIEYMAGVGEWREALALGEQMIPAARALGQGTLLPRLLVWTGLIHRGMGDLERARAHVEEAWALAGAGRDQPEGAVLDVHALVPAHTGMAGYLVTVGEHRRALDVGEAGLAVADRTGYVAWAVYRLLPFVIESAIYLEDYERAARHNERLRRDSAALGHPLGLAWAATTDALLAYFTGPPERAVPMLRAAAAELEAVPFVFDAARLRRMMARALSDAGDPAAAGLELRRAHDVFARLGAERELRGTREQLRALGARPPAQSAAAGDDTLSGRELEIARLVAARRSNKEIAAELDISPRTVSTHLSNIFAKLGVASRGELADRVRVRGLSAGA